VYDDTEVHARVQRHVRWLSAGSAARALPTEVPRHYDLWTPVSVQRIMISQYLH
jgi:hypothetical protein